MKTLPCGAFVVVRPTPGNSNDFHSQGAQIQSPAASDEAIVKPSAYHRHYLPFIAITITAHHFHFTSTLIGPGRAGKQGTLLGASGGRYQGEVLAGRPHGRGKYFVRKVRHVRKGCHRSCPSYPGGQSASGKCRLGHCGYI